MTRPGEPLDVLLGRAVVAASLDGPDSDDDAAVFAAVVRVIADHGVRAVTMDRIATASGVSRATLFRRFESKDGLLQQALTHEVRQFLKQMAHALNETPSVPDRIVGALTSALSLSSHPLLYGDLDEVDRSDFRRALTSGSPSALELGHEFVTGRIASAQASGEIPPGDADLKADVLIHVVLGYALVPHSSIDITDESVLRTIATKALLPIVMGG